MPLLGHPGILKNRRPLTCGAYLAVAGTANRREFTGIPAEERSLRRRQPACCVLSRARSGATRRDKCPFNNPSWLRRVSMRFNLASTKHPPFRTLMPVFAAPRCLFRNSGQNRNAARLGVHVRFAETKRCHRLGPVAAS